jgi:hypothetical protein
VVVTASTLCCDGCADGVIAEDGALSRHLMAEDLAAEIAGAAARRDGPAGARELQAGQDPAAGASPDEAFGISLIATARKPATRAR